MSRIEAAADLLEQEGFESEAELLRHAVRMRKELDELRKPKEPQQVVVNVNRSPLRRVLEAAPTWGVVYPPDTFVARDRTQSEEE